MYTVPSTNLHFFLNPSTWHLKATVAYFINMSSRSNAKMLGFKKIKWKFEKHLEYNYIIYRYMVNNMLS